MTVVLFCLALLFGYLLITGAGVVLSGRNPLAAQSVGLHAAFFLLPAALLTGLTLFHRESPYLALGLTLSLAFASVSAGWISALLEGRGAVEGEYDMGKRSLAKFLIGLSVIAWMGAVYGAFELLRLAGFSLDTWML